MELKPCPFCGSNNTDTDSSEKGRHNNWWWAYCKDCEAEGPIVRIVLSGDGEKLAAEAWNSYAKSSEFESAADIRIWLAESLPYYESEDKDDFIYLVHAKDIQRVSLELWKAWNTRHPKTHTPITDSIAIPGAE